MIRFIEHTGIDKKKWDACVNASATACVFVTSWYLDAVCESWNALVLGDYEAVFPLAPRSKYKICYLYQPFFSRYFGVYTKGKLSEKLVADFFKAIPEKYRYMEFCLHEQNEFSDKRYELKERKYQLLDLHQPYEVLQKNYSDNAKRNVKKSLKAGCRTEKNIPAKEVVDLFKRTKGQELELFTAGDYKILLKIMETCVSLGQSESIAVYDKEGELCAAGFFMKYKNRYVFLKSGVTDAGKNNGCMHLLFDTFIKENADMSAILDFGGSSVESVARFYKNFGAKDCVYLQVKRNSLPKLVNWIKSLKS